jgi:recombination protein RecT
MIMALPATKDTYTKFSDQLAEKGGEWGKVLPAHIPAERFARVVMTAVQRDPDLLFADRASLFTACLIAAQDGLLPDKREGALVVFNTKVKRDGREEWIKQVQWMPMIGGLLKKIRNSGQLKSIGATVVYEGDRFRHWIDNDGEHIEYESGEQQNRQVIRRVFAMAKLKDNTIVVEILTPDDVEKIRRVSKSRDKGPWVDWWEEMAKKSAIRRLAKRLPLSTDLDDLIRRDDHLYDFEGASDRARLPAGAPRSLAARMDALALGNDATPHDPDTGEITAGAPPAESSPAALSPVAEAGSDDLPATGGFSSDDDDDGFPGDRPMPAAATDAPEGKGRKAYREGLGLRAMPPEFNDEGREVDAAAWKKGWREERDRAAGAS